jgi:hypothetical protein
VRRTSRIHLVDLAGSERAKKTAAEGARGFAEADVAAQAVGDAGHEHPGQAVTPKLEQAGGRGVIFERGALADVGRFALE